MQFIFSDVEKLRNKYKMLITLIVCIKKLRMQFIFSGDQKLKNKYKTLIMLIVCVGKELYKHLE